MRNLFLLLLSLILVSSAPCQILTDSGLRLAAKMPSNTLQEDKGLVIYPNPNQGVFTVMFSGFTGKKIELQIYNVIGNLVYRETLSDFELNNPLMIDLSDQPKGLYYLKVETRDFSQMRKIVIR